MENQDTNQSLFELHFDENVKQSLRGAATMGGVAALVSILGSALGLINYFVAKNNPKTDRFESLPEMRTETTGSGNLAGVILSLIISIFLFYFLNRFSKITKAGIDGNNQLQISEGLGSLASYFKIIGVLLIICIVLVALVLAVGIGSGI